MKQIEKNTVPAKNQLKKNNSVTYEQKEGNGLRVMFVGNSITRHGVLPDIGWHWDWGMAASAKEKDYVHLLIKKINETNPDAAYCICQVSEWEQGYKNGSEFLELYKEARDFQADLIIFRMIENCPWKDFDSDVFYKEYQNLIDYLNPTGKAKIILTTAFWKHTGDDTIRKVAKERNYPLVELSHLGEEDEMKAIGLFEHAGVANHPGDLGMQTIAELIAEKLRDVMNCHIYPVIPLEEKCRDYIVKINGHEVETNTARVSAVPFNRRWPGHQRGKEQTELIQFVSLQMNAAIEIEVIPQYPSENIVIRPLEFGISPKKLASGGVKFTLEKPSYFVIEAYGRNRALHFFADPTTLYSVDKEDENVIYFGAGEHDVGMLRLQSNQTVFIDEGAVVYACIHATDADNIRILGRGILDNSKNKETILFEANEENNEIAVYNAKRLHTIQFEYCNNIEIDGITIRDSLVYNIRPLACKNLNIRNVKIIGCWRYNSDGIDMHNCENVHISDCFIRTFDDSICVKGFDGYHESDVEKATQEAMNHNGVCYDTFKCVVAERCVIWNDWGKCLEIGAETRAEEMCDIVFRDCWIVHATGPVLDCCNVDYADVHDITYENISVEMEDELPAARLQRNDAEVYQNPNPDYAPPLIFAEVMCHPEYSAGGTRRGKNRRLFFRNIRLYGKHAPRMVFRGYDSEHQTSDVEIREIYWNGEKIASLSEEQLIIRDFCENITLE